MPENENLDVGGPREDPLQTAGTPYRVARDSGSTAALVELKRLLEDGAIPQSIFALVPKSEKKNLRLLR